jgi:hypothetical protein
MKNLKQTKRQQTLNKIEQIKDLGTNMDEFVRNNVQGSFDKAIGDFINRVQQNITKSDVAVTGKISDIRIDSSDDLINIIANEWLVYQSRGVSGTQKKYNTPHFYSTKTPPVQPILDWVKRKNINTRNQEQEFQEEVEFTDDEKLQKSIAYAIRNTIFKEGIKPKNLYEKEIPKLIEDLNKAGVGAVVQSLNQVIDGIKANAQRVIMKK